MPLPKSIRNIIPDVLTARFTIEQLTLMDSAADDMITDLYSRREDAKFRNDDTISIPAIERRIKVLRRAQRVIHEAIDV